MKSLLVSSTDFPPQTGGISRVMAALASALGPDRMCCLTAVSPDCGTTENSLTPRVYRRPAAFAKQSHIQAIGFSAAMIEIMLRERPQLVQVATAYDGYVGLWLRRWFKLPFVVYAHGNEILDAIESNWQKPRLSLVQAARVLAVSRFTAQLVQNAGVEPGRIEIVHPGCDIDRFRPHRPRIDVKQELLGAGRKDPVMLSVGRLVERKGHDMVIRALPRLVERFPNVAYLIVGQGPAAAKLEALAFTMGVRDRVIFAAHIADDLLPEAYAVSDVFVMPSRERLESGDVEGFGLVFLEANACAKAVVAGRSGGVSDAVIDGFTGFLVDPLDPEDIATAITRILSSPDLAARLGQQGSDRVRREFTWSRFAERVHDISASVVREHAAKGKFPR